jgi:uncharacterized protein
VSVFVDTSALFAVIDEDDHKHDVAVRVWQDLLDGSEDLVSSNYVVTETFALLQRRLGLEYVRAFQSRAVPALRVEWVDAPLHTMAVAALLTAGGRQLSLVDCVSFELMRRLGVITVFAFDDDFADQGFTCLS